MTYSELLQQMKQEKVVSLVVYRWVLEVVRKKPNNTVSKGDRRFYKDWSADKNNSKYFYPPHPRNQ